jgi:hypothetical protein
MTTKAQSTEITRDDAKYLASRGLASFAVTDYLTIVDELATNFFPESNYIRAAAPLWIWFDYIRPVKSWGSGVAAIAPRSHFYMYIFTWITTMQWMIRDRERLDIYPGIIGPFLLTREDGRGVWLIWAWGITITTTCHGKGLANEAAWRGRGVSAVQLPGTIARISFRWRHFFNDSQELGDCRQPATQFYYFW